MMTGRGGGRGLANGDVGAEVGTDVGIAGQRSGAVDRYMKASDD
jgi:hypothetical protein